MSTLTLSRNGNPSGKDHALLPSLDLAARKSCWHWSELRLPDLYDVPHLRVVAELLDHRTPWLCFAKDPLQCFFSDSTSDRVSLDLSRAFKKSKVRQTATYTEKLQAGHRKIVGSQGKNGRHEVWEDISEQSRRKDKPAWSVWSWHGAWNHKRCSSGSGCIRQVKAISCLVHILIALQWMRMACHRCNLLSRSIASLANLACTDCTYEWADWRRWRRLLRLITL